MKWKNARTGDAEVVLGKVRDSDWRDTGWKSAEMSLSRRGRSVSAPRLSELIARAEERERERGLPIVMEGDFANDVEGIVNARKPRTPPASRQWE